ncbi:DUF3386 family protein [Planctomicrobium sp. SH668]|uniref:DUF3386 family protein n=1 Tax=Planctomicrobium sp. SH668 TaxID=3448126 RepID=UPI003F5BED9C
MSRLFAMAEMLPRSRYVFALTASIGMMIGSGSLRAEHLKAVHEAASAVELMKIAHEGRSEWLNFSGFTADFEAATADGVVAGKVVVSKEGAVEVSLPEDQRFQWVERSLDSLIGHRLQTSEPVTDVEFADDQVNHPHGRLLRSTNGDDKSQWRVKGDVTTEVHRVTPKTRFIISVGDVYWTEEKKHLPRDFSVTTWDRETNQILTARQVHNEWKRIGTVDLPTLHRAITNRADGTTEVHQIRFFHHQLNQSTTSAQ